MKILIALSGFVIFLLIPVIGIVSINNLFKTDIPLNMLNYMSVWALVLGYIIFNNVKIGK